MNKKLTKRQKFIASCMVPTYGGFSNVIEIKETKLQAWGKYWIDTDYQEYVAYSPSGRRQFFTYEFSSSEHWKTKKKRRALARKAANLWAKGKYKEARKCDEMNWDQYRNRVK